MKNIYRTTGKVATLFSPRGLDVALLIERALNITIIERNFGRKCNGRGEIIEREEPTAMQRKLRARFRGCLVTYDGREDAKCQAYELGNRDISLDVAIMALLLVARAHWSRDVVDKTTRRQFSDYVPIYVQYESWPTHGGRRFSEARQALLLAFGCTVRELKTRDVFR